MWILSLEFMAFVIHLHSLIVQSLPVNTTNSAANDVTETKRRTELHNRLDIYFVDKHKGNLNSDETRPYTSDITPDPFGDNTERKLRGLPEDTVHEFLLTAADNKQANSRHELYKNPTIPEIQFRTESPFSLQTVASPFFVQNVQSVQNEKSVQNLKSVQNVQSSGKAKQRLRKHVSRRKRGVIPQLTDNKEFPQIQMKDISWFKKYQNLYNNIMKKNNIQLRDQINLQKQREANYDEQNWQQNSMNPVPRSQIPSNDYHQSGYVYPLYHLHTSDSQVMPSYMIRNYARPRQMTEGRQPQSNYNEQGYYSTQNSQRSPNQLNNQMRTDVQKAYPPQPPPQNALYQFKPPSKTYSPHQQTAASETALQSIGLKDDASFIDASPNFDHSAWTLNAIQSIIPNAQARNAIPHLEKKPMTSIQQNKQGDKQTQSNNPKTVYLSKPVQDVNLKNTNYVTRPNVLVNADKARSNFLMNAANSRQLKVDKPVTISSLQNNRASKITSPSENNSNGNKLKLENIDHSGSISPSSIEHTEQKKAVIPTANNNNVEIKSLTGNFFKPSKDTKALKEQKNTSSNSNSRDVIYKEISPGTDIDSDDVTAENLVTIFSELDSDANDAVSELAKKDAISTPESESLQPNNQIEMTVLKSPAKEDNIKSKDKEVTFVNVPFEKENAINFEQKIEPLKLKDGPVDSPTKARDTVAKQNFDLKSLHFGLSNGNTFE